jgi:VWFA-related protein
MLAALLGLGAVSAQGAEQTFSEATDVVVVEVPVQVIRDGEPVRGLTADDFEVYEGRKKLPVTGFEVLDLNAVQAKTGEAWKPAQGISARRHFLLLFDMGSASPKTVAQARAAALDLLAGLHPSDLTGVATYRPSKGPELLLGFTTDREQARAALDRLGMPEMLDRAADPLRLVLNAPMWSGDLGGGGGGGGGSGRGSGGGGPRSGDRRDALEAARDGGDTPFTSTFSVPMAQAERAVRKRAVAAMSRGYADLAKAMGGLYGRKYVVLFSEGFDSALFQGTANVDQQNTMAAASMMGAVWGVDSEQRFGSTKTTNDLETMLEEFRRNDCVIQTVDIGGLRERGGAEEQWAGNRDSLFVMADATGGELYENFNDLSAAMDQMLRKTSVTYVLAFQPEGIRKDGGYHRLRVELKNAPRGTRLVHRPGYYAPRPFQERSSTEKLMQTAQQVLSGRESGGIPLDVLAAPFPVAAGGPSYVPVVIEADGPSLLDGLTPGSLLPAEFYVYAMDAAGAVRGFFSQTVALDLAKVEPALRQSGLKFFGHLDLEPGQYSVRVLVRNGTTGAAGMKVASLQVPPASPAEPVLLPAFFPEEPGRWLIVREAAREGDRSVPYPFMAGEQPFIPASRPAFTPGQEATVALVGYHLGEGDLRANARVLTADGREAGPAELHVVRRSGGEGVDQVQAALRTPRLQPGEYLLVVTLTDPAGGSESSVTPFVVKG